jgi:hypothetical protein
MMAEPTKLYQNDEVLIVAAPSEVQRLIDEGWSLTKPEVIEPETEELDAEEQAQPARRGRPKKTT